MSWGRGGSEFGDFESRRSQQPRANPDRIKLGVHQCLVEIPGVLPAGGVYLHGIHLSSKMGIMVILEKDETTKEATGALVYECGPVTGMPLGEPLEMERGAAANNMLVAELMGPSAGAAPMSANTFSGGGWLLTISTAGGELTREPTA